ncbi:MAG: hypothetical protein HYZ72_05890 [Deltaproteobacteria bacterium]|nr:hypothetical protein [Deltaproteobacteria bacterium]
MIEDPSLYEKYTQQEIPDNVRARLSSFFGGYEPVYRSADITTFNTPHNFWHTDDGKGIADYTNRGFVSAGTNFDQYDPRRFPLPTVGTEWAEDKTALCQEISQRSGVPLPTGPAGQALLCLMPFIRTYVKDTYQPSQSGYNDKTSTYSIFNAELTKYHHTHLYTLNRFNFEAAYPFLIKRAVGYSAGLLNYFFRGKLDFLPDPSNPNQYLIKNLGPDDMQGTFTLYYDDADGNRQEVPGAKWTISVTKGAQTAVPTFAPPTTPAPKTPGEYLLVFKGEMGEEKPVNGSIGAVVAQYVTPPAPFLLTTSSGVYKSGNFDQEWVKIRDDGFDIFAEYYIRSDLMFHANGTVWRSVDGGLNYDNVEEGTDYRIDDLTYLGGMELLFDACPLVYSVCGTLYSPDLGATLEFRPFDDTVRFTSTVRYVGNGTVLRVGIPYTTGEGWMLYKSTDKGGSWTRVPGAAGVSGTNAYDQWVVDNLWWNQVEGEGSVVFAAGLLVSSFTDSVCGLWKSTDGGTTWRLVWSFGSACHDQVWSLAIDPQGQALLVVNHTYSDFFLYRSQDAGETWEQIEAPDGSTPYGVMYLGNNLGVNP